jgi:hypothetical protein
MDSEGTSPLARVSVLAPSGQSGLQAFLDGTPPCAEPFALERREALAALSVELLHDPAVRQDPASVAAAFWLRRANLERFVPPARPEGQGPETIVRVASGRVFHIAPANVDTLFLYSWALAFLCGNASVVRLSRQQAPAVTALLAALSRIAPAWPALPLGNRFITYDPDDAITERLSAWCTHRVVWGGNTTIKALRAIPLNPNASERCFASKTSFSLLKAASFLAADADARKRLAEGFFKDVFAFDQAACSSPQAVFWVGDAGSFQEASRAFLDALQAEAERRGHRASPSQTSRRILAAFDVAIRGDAGVDISRPAITAILPRRLEDTERGIVGGGFVRVVRLEDPLDLTGFLGEGDQTITHFGFGGQELKAMASAFGARGVDRLVPVGEALAFEPIWDGYDLIEDFTRKVVVRSQDNI